MLGSRLEIERRAVYLLKYKYVYKRVVLKQKSIHTD